MSAVPKLGVSNVVGYLEFVVRFMTHPVKYTTSLAGSGHDGINEKLAVYLVVGVGLAYVISIVFNAFGIAIMLDPGLGDEFYLSVLIEAIARIVSLGPLLTPIVVLLLIFLFAVLFHVSVVVWLVLVVVKRSIVAFVLREDYRPVSWGTVWDSVNASFAFSAFYIPWAVLLLLLAEASLGTLPGLSEVMYAVLVVTFPIYLIIPWAVFHGMDILTAFGNALGVVLWGGWLVANVLLPILTGLGYLN